MCNVETEYEKTFGALLKSSKALSDVYEAAHPDCKIKFYDGAPHSANYRAQGWKPSRSVFTGYGKKCPRCQSNNVSEQQLLANCRHNGDGCGSFIYHCGVCGLLDWHSYDEA